MKRLFIDTHGEKITILLDNNGHLYEESAISNRSHSEVAVSTLERILNEADISTVEIDEIVVVNGPGSFTGVRIGVVIAKTIAYTLNIPIKTITSLEAIGESSNENFDLVIVEDSKGVYSAKKTNSGYEGYKYQRRNEFEEYVNQNNYKVLKSENINCESIFKYLENKEYVNPHLVNPIYIKEIDALK